jgi:hypothetical protein
MKTKTKIKRETRKFFKKFFFRLASKILELTVLFAIGYAMGLKLVRY